jgi:hypothetical protein
MEHNKTSVDFPIELYQNFSEIIKSRVMALFSALHDEKMKLFFLNFGEMILLPKVNEAGRSRRTLYS